MKRFIIQIVVFVIALIGIIIATAYSTSYIVSKRAFLNHQTESNLLIIKDNQHYDLTFMGISHARNFSRHKNHVRVEENLNKKVINIGQGANACGVNEQLFYLDYFYFKENRTDKIVYVLSPPLLFSETLPVASNTFDYEPFDLTFLRRYLKFESENKQERVISYLQSKGSLDWLNHVPSSKDKMDTELEYLDSLVVQKGMSYAYTGSVDKKRFEKSCKIIEKTIDLGLSNNTEIILIIPPAVFGKWIGHEDIVKFGQKMAYKPKVSFFDFSESIVQPEYYYDHHHLNSKGVDHFINLYLGPILE